VGQTQKQADGNAKTTKLFSQTRLKSKERRKTSQKNKEKGKNKSRVLFAALLPNELSMPDIKRR
jgi:hypothetical protein